VSEAVPLTSIVAAPVVVLFEGVVIDSKGGLVSVGVVTPAISIIR
jgi:hypothetical protein